MSTERTPGRRNATASLAGAIGRVTSILAIPYGYTVTLGAAALEWDPDTYSPNLTRGYWIGTKATKAKGGSWGKRQDRQRWYVPTHIRVGLNWIKDY